MSGTLRFVLGLSLAGGATCLAVFALGLPFRKLVKKSWLFYLWLVVLVRFIVPVPLNLPFVSDGISALGAALSSAAEPAQTTIFDESAAINSVPASNEMVQVPDTVPVDTIDNATSPLTEGAAPVDSEAAPAVIQPEAPAETPAVPADLSVLDLLPYAWLLGALLMLLWTVTGYALTLMKLRQNRVLLTPGRVPVYESGNIATPVLAGIVRPAVYLPMGFPNRALAVQHELTHFRRGDIWLKWLVQLTVCVHWFNPLAWLMKRELNRLCELACDSTVLRRLDPPQQHAYGQMLLDTAYAVTDKSGILIASLGKDKCLLAERIVEIVKAKKTSRKTVAAMSVLAALILCAAVVFGALFSGCTAKSETGTPSASNIDTPPNPTIESTIVSFMPTATVPEDFVDDPNVIGTWQQYGYSNNNSDIVQVVFSDTGYPLIFAPKGQMNEPCFTWTKGSVLITDGSAMVYNIHEVDGTPYLFLENQKKIKYKLETYDYTVYKWDSTDYQFQYYTDNIDLPFTDDPAVHGTWKLVSFCENNAKFDPSKPFLADSQVERTFSQDGVLSGTKTDAGSTWTKGYVINPIWKTASAYEIKEIDGATYMFVEYKDTSIYTHDNTVSVFNVWQKVTDDAPAPSPSAAAASPLTYTIPSDPPAGFVTDPDVIGTWQPYTLIKSISDFSPDSGDALIRFSSVMLIAYENGRINDPSTTWTKGFFSCYGGQMNYEYVVSDIEGVKYLFLKLPVDVPYNGENYRYEVFKWYSEPLKKKLYIDNIDLPFADDPAIIGTWQLDNMTVKIEYFEPGKPTTVNPDNTYTFNEGGAAVRSLYAGNAITGYSWTKGFILDPFIFTASAYVIKEIDGVTYMFVQFKEGGIYTSSHTLNGYMVWKKIS